jgi:DNA-binding response OmpR family regulator
MENCCPNCKADLSLTVADLRIELLTRQVSRRGKLIKLSEKEFELLMFLAQRTNTLLTAAEIGKHVFGYLDSDSQKNASLVYISGLRRKLDGKIKGDLQSNQRLIKTFREKGYVFGGSSCPTK